MKICFRCAYIGMRLLMVCVYCFFAWIVADATLKEKFPTVSSWFGWPRHSVLNTAFLSAPEKVILINPPTVQNIATHTRRYLHFPSDESQTNPPPPPQNPHLSILTEVLAFTPELNIKVAGNTLFQSVSSQKRAGKSYDSPSASSSSPSASPSSSSSTAASSSSASPPSFSSFLSSYFPFSPSYLFSSSSSSSLFFFVNLLLNCSFVRYLQYWLRLLGLSRVYIWLYHNPYISLLISIACSSTALLCIIVVALLPPSIRRVALLFLTWNIWLLGGIISFVLRLSLGFYHFFRIIIDLWLFVGLSIFYRIFSFTCRLYIFRKSGVQEELYRRLDTAKSYEEWMQVKNILETLDENNSPSDKDAYPSGLDYETLRTHICSLREARLKYDSKALHFLIGACCHRNFCNASNPALFASNQSPSKDLVLAFEDEVCVCLEKICEEFHCRVSNLMKKLKAGEGDRNFKFSINKEAKLLEDDATAAITPYHDTLFSGCRSTSRRLTVPSTNCIAERFLYSSNDSIPRLLPVMPREEMQNATHKGQEPQESLQAPCPFCKSVLSGLTDRTKKCKTAEKEVQTDTIWCDELSAAAVASPLNKSSSLRDLQVKGEVSLGTSESDPSVCSLTPSSHSFSRKESDKEGALKMSFSVNLIHENEHFDKEFGSSNRCNKYGSKLPLDISYNKDDKDRSGYGFENPDSHTHIRNRSSSVSSIEEKQEIEDWKKAFAAIEDTRMLFSNIRLSMGRTALCLSGGGSLAMYHMGVVRELLQRGILPRVISGASGGAIVAAILAIYDDETLLNEILIPSISTRYNCRWFPPILQQLKNLMATGYMMKLSEFAATCEAYFGSWTFRTAYMKTGRLVSIVCTPAGKHPAEPLVLNCISSPDILIWSAVVSSCGLPGLVEPSQLYAASPEGKPVPGFPGGRKFIDGSIKMDIPQKELSSLFNVKQFIVSQVNPHAAPFVTTYSAKGKFARSLENWVTFDIKSRYWVLAKLNVIPKIYGQNISTFWMVQEFEGDITITPRASLFDWYRMIAQPSYEDMEYYLSAGAERTWQHISRIEHILRIELHLRRNWASMESEYSRLRMMISSFQQNFD